MNTLFKATDRCDRCGAQAYVKVDIKGFSLLFCAHHYRENKQHLSEQGAVVVADNTVQLAKSGA